MKTTRDDMRKYFYGSFGPLVLLAAGLFLGLLLLANGEFMIVLNIWFFSVIGSIALGIYQANSNNVYAEQQYDSYVAQDLKDFQEKAMERLGIIQEQVELIDPIKGSGPFFDYEQLDEKKNNISNIYHPTPRLIFKIGSDNRVRYSLIQATIFFFSDEQIYVYQVDYDVCSSKIFGDRTYEYFYRDIDCVVTGKRTEKVSQKKSVEKEYEYFSVVVTSGTTSKAICDSDESILDHQVMAMRELIRNKKQEMA